MEHQNPTPLLQKIQATGVKGFNVSLREEGIMSIRAFVPISYMEMAVASVEGTDFLLLLQTLHDKILELVNKPTIMQDILKNEPPTIR